MISMTLLLLSCKAYKQDIMFKLDDDFTEEDLSSLTSKLDKNYELRVNDALLLDVFTNDGERLIDPNMEMLTNVQGGQQQQLLRDNFQYIIQGDSIVTFPMIGNMNLTGMTLYEAELRVAAEFGRFYEGAFVKMRITNRRVFVLGAPGGKVVPLENENTSLIEVLSLAEGIDLGAKAQNIKVIRDKQVFLVDLSTISGMMETNMFVQPGDIVYVEPWRRPWLETLRDVSPALSLVSSVLTLIVVVQNL